MSWPHKVNIDHPNCFGHFGLAYDDLISLSGIYGYKKLPHENYDSIEIYYYSNSPDEAHIEILQDAISLYRVINLQNRVINNSSFSNPNQQKQGIGTRILLSQIEYARMHGFHLIELTAARNHVSGMPSQVGYIVWAKLGFTMSESDRNKFIRHLMGTRYEHDIDYLQDLLYHSTDGQGEIFWHRTGFTWQGHYKLENASDNELLTRVHQTKKCVKLN